MYLCRTHTKESLHEIGSHFGGRDHSTVINAIKKIKKLLQDDNEFKGIIEKINGKLL
jgi:chromosomal replication initiator protein